MSDSIHLSAADLAALAFFLVVWVAHTLASDGKLVRRMSLTTAMNAQREAWMRNMAARDNRFMDGQLLGHALSSASFFASSNLLLIAGIAGALFGGERTFRSASSLVGIQTSTRLLFEGQLALILLTLVRGLLEFMWSIRQMNYCLAAFGAAPLESTPEEQKTYGDITARLLNPALSSFNMGVRAYYFAIPAAAWLFGAVISICATVACVSLLLLRQRRSPAAAAVSDLRKLLEQ